MQADELTTAVARTRAMVMEEAIEKLNGVRREVEAVHSEMSMRPTKNELKAALDTVGAPIASALTELRQQVSSGCCISHRRCSGVRERRVRVKAFLRRRECEAGAGELRPARLGGVE